MPTASANQPMLEQALDHLRSAIDLLDRAAAQGHIAAHVDLAVHELRKAISARAAQETVPARADAEGLQTISTFSQRRRH